MPLCVLHGQMQRPAPTIAQTARTVNLLLWRGVSGDAITAAARSLAAAADDGVTVMLGRPSLAESAEVIGEAAQALQCLPSVRFLSTLRRGNIHGALDIGLAPGLLPGRQRLSSASTVEDSSEVSGNVTSISADDTSDGKPPDDSDSTSDVETSNGAAPDSSTPLNSTSNGEASDVEPSNGGASDGSISDDETSAVSEGRLKKWWPCVPAGAGLNARGVLKAAADGQLDVLILLGADPLNDFPDRELARRGLRGAGLVAAVDMFVNDSAALAADVVLAAAGPTESEGTFTNLEGRISSMGHKVTPPGTARAAWVIAAELAFRLGHGRSVDLGFDSPSSIRAELAQASEFHSPITAEALAAEPLEGVLLNGALLDAAEKPAYPNPTLTTGSDPAIITEPLAEQPSARSNSRVLRLVAARTMYDDGVMQRHCAAIRNLARPPEARVHPSELQRLGLSDGTKVRVSSHRGHLDAMLVTDVGVPEGSLAVPWLAPGAPTNALIAADAAFTAVTVSER